MYHSLGCCIAAPPFQPGLGLQFSLDYDLEEISCQVHYFVAGSVSISAYLPDCPLLLVYSSILLNGFFSSSEIDTAIIGVNGEEW